MKRTTKRQLCWLLTICMVLSLLPMTALALEQPPVCGQEDHVHGANCYVTQELSEGDSGSRGDTTDPVTDPVADPVTDPVTNPPEAPAPETPVPDPVTEAVTEPPEPPIINPDAVPVIEPGVLFQAAGLDIMFMSAALTDNTKFATFALMPQGGGTTSRSGIIGDDTVTVSMGAGEATLKSVVIFTTVTSGAVVKYGDDVIASGELSLDFKTSHTFTVSCEGEEDRTYTVTTIEAGKAAQPYGIGVKTKAGEHYNVGDTVTYEVYATGPTVQEQAAANAMAIGSFQFTMDYDEAQLTYGQFTATHAGQTTTSAINGTVEIAYAADDKIEVNYTQVGSDYTGYVKLGEITYTVKNTIPEQTNALTDGKILTGAGIVLEITPDGYDYNVGSITLESDTDSAYLHNNIVTFRNNHTTGVPENSKAYVKYGQAGLYTGNAYNTAFTVPAVTADTGYRLVNGTGENLWHAVEATSPGALIGNYTDAAALEAAALVAGTQTDNVIITPNVLWQVAVTFASADANKGTVNVAEGMTLTNTYDEGVKLNGDPDYTMPSVDQLSPAAGYKFQGWTLDPTPDGGAAIDYIDLETYTVPGATQAAYTVYAVFVDADYIWHDQVDDVTTTTIVSGVEDVTNKIIHGTDIVFTVAPDDADHYIITKVEYSVGQNGDKIQLTMDESGQYTVPGAAIIGDIYLHVTTNHFITLTYDKGAGIEDTAFHFLKVTGVDENGYPIYQQETVNEQSVNKAFTSSAIYAKHGEAGLYADTACTEKIELLSPETIDAEETSRYRTPTGAGDDEYAWVSGANRYHTGSTTAGAVRAIADTTFTDDMTMTSRAIQQFKVNFAIGEIGAGSGDYGANFGMNSSNAAIRSTFEWYDTGAALTIGYDNSGENPVYTGNVPETFLEPGYTGGVWNPVFTNVSESTTYTFTVAHGTYDITFNNTDAVDYTAHENVTVSAVPEDNTEVGTVTHTATGGAVKFKAAGIINNAAGGTSFVITGITATIGGQPYQMTRDGDFYVINGDDIIGVVVITPTYAEYVKITFTGDEGVSSADVIAYARKGVPGLYNSTSFTGDPDFTVPTPTAKTNYRLYDVNPLTAAYWTTGGVTPAYVNAGTIGTTALNGNTTYTAATVKTITITFTAPANGTLNGSTAAPASITFDDGTTLGALTSPAFPAAAPNEGFAYTGWTHDNGTAATDDDANIEAANISTTQLTWLDTGSYTFTAVFTELSFKWLPPLLENASIDANYPTGVAWNGAGTDDDTVTYNTPVTFRLTASANHAIRVDGVRYKAGNGDWVTMTADNGLYTIPGNAILGDLQLSVTAEEYVTITFQAGTGNTLNTTTAIAKKGVATLYTNLNEFISGNTSFTVPVPVAAEGYRLRKDTAGGEELWETSESPTRLLTSIGAAGAMYGGDTTLTARSQKTWQVTFTNTDTFASFAGSTSSTSITIDDNTYVTAAQIPGITYVPGNVFDKWVMTGNGTQIPTDIADNNGLISQQIKADTSFNLVTRDGEYNISFEGGTVATFTSSAGIVVTSTSGAGILAGRVTHDTDALFTVEHQDGKRITGITVTIANGETINLTAASAGQYHEFNGQYIIAGDKIVGDITVTVTSTDTHTVTFVSGGHGTVGGTTSFVVDTGGSLTSAQLNSVTTAADTAYTFDHWELNGVSKSAIEITGAVVTSNMEYTAVFVSPARTITDVNSVIAAYTAGYTDDKAFYNQPVTFTVITNKVVTAVYYSVNTPNGDNTESATWSAISAVPMNADGSYTIPGDVITGNIRITATVLTNGSGGTNLSMEFISREEYKAIVAETYNKKILVLNGAIAGDKYHLADGTELYWSGKYTAAVCWVDADETAATLAPGMTVTTGTPANTIAYTGDINGSGRVTAADAMIINDCLHDQRLISTSNMELFKLDVEDTRNPDTGTWNGTDGYKYVSASDVTWTLTEAVK